MNSLIQRKNKTNLENKNFFFFFFHKFRKKQK